MNSLKKASAQTSGNKLIVSTGEVTRIWMLTPFGLVTQSIDKGEDKYETLESMHQCDWNLAGILPQTTMGKLVALRAEKSDDEGFTSDHLQVTAEFEYKEQGLGLKYEIWAYPKAPGLRTQLFVRKLGSYDSNLDTASEATPKSVIFIK